MDSLLANYASSSDEEKEEVKQPKQQKPSTSSLFSSLPPPSFTSTSTSSSLKRNKGGLKEPAPPASFSSLPPPSSFVPKRVVEFRPPPIKPFNFDDDEDEEADRDQKRRKESQSNSSVGSSSVKSFLSSIPAPKNSFSALGGRRSAIDTQTPTSATAEASKVETHPANNFGNFDSEAASYAGYESGVAQNDAFNTQPPTSSGSDAYGVENHPTTDYGSFDPNAAYYANNETGYDQNPGQYVDAGYGSYEVYGHQHCNNWGDGSVAAIPQTESALRILGKRSKIPAEIVEVKQDELMKNRPREDQSKMTGIAFGPSYQPVSSKGKPTKLHKRKHQIGSLFFDMKQKEMELAERRSKGFLTKAETHAKYGW